ncbi:hypothetical protein BCR34DRAFT_623599 [Clohesyomyces aquaticus]|uniref:DUF1770-domain-containing protein n=1 Tax=Clohesyomyces aquaticus TaxID=1231657 RepID=A0A1Y1ZUB5_9PLEO|nr:hypothetical protein BCR34DRAFT_623599 [Clohesyomyces aquaticus]
MSSDAPAELTSILQSASIQRHPSPRHDLNPPTAASSKQPVQFNDHPDPDDEDSVAEDEVPLSTLRPIPRRQNMPPLPDLRFEQSYLKSIEKAKSWKGVLWITVRDQVIMCFASGVLWTLVLSGWRHWNRETKFSGRSVGARLRRWWWGVNKWALPTEKKGGLRDTKLVRKARDARHSLMDSWDF